MLSTPPTLAAFLLAASTASAAITIPTVSVGDAGNPSDWQSSDGKVTYDYHIGTHEVTNSQYTAFLNAVAATDTHDLYSSSMGTDSDGGISRSGSSGSFSYSTRTDMADKPVNFVSFWDAARFANWLTNRQPTGAQGPGTTEDGMYNLDGVTNPDNSSVTRQLDFSAGENGVAVTSADEWHKAAYYDGNGDYYLYPTQSDQITNPSDPTNAANTANYSGAVGSVTEVGAYPNSGSHYGTFDQGGNVLEWIDEIMYTTRRGLQGGSFNSRAGDYNALEASSWDVDSAPVESSRIGFRVSSLAPIDPYSLQSQSGPGGTVSPTGTFNYPTVTEVTVTATPDAGYVFDLWSGSVSGTNPQISLTLDQDHDITATFVPDQSDPDSDGLTNYEETTYGSDPNVADTSGDGLKDGVVANAGFDPTTDFSGLISSGPLAMDTNGNGLTDSFENSPNSSTLNNLGYYTQQSFSDGRPGAITISADDQGGVMLELQIQRSEDLVEWSSDPADLIQIPLTLSGDNEFFRFAIPE